MFFPKKKINFIYLFSLFNYCKSICITLPTEIKTRYHSSECKKYGYWKDNILIESVEEEYYLKNYKKKFQRELDYIKNILLEKERKYDSSNIEIEFKDS